jgi:hypothetical protein
MIFNLTKLINKKVVYIIFYPQKAFVRTINNINNVNYEITLLMW